MISAPDVTVAPRPGYLVTRLPGRCRAGGWHRLAEVRAITHQGRTEPHIGVALLAAAQDIDGIEDLPIPARDDVARTVDFE